MDTHGKKIILASNSPRRRELLAGLGIEFTVDADTSFVEEYSPDTPHVKIPELMSEGKSIGLHRELEDDEILITSDTMVKADPGSLFLELDAAAPRARVGFVKGHGLFSNDGQRERCPRNRGREAPRWVDAWRRCERGAAWRLQRASQWLAPGVEAAGTLRFTPDEIEGLRMLGVDFDGARTQHAVEGCRTSRLSIPRRASHKPRMPRRWARATASTTPARCVQAGRGSGHARSHPAAHRRGVNPDSQEQRSWGSPSQVKGNAHPWRGTWGSPFGMLHRERRSGSVAHQMARTH